MTAAAMAVTGRRRRPMSHRWRINSRRCECRCRRLTTCCIRSTPGHRSFEAAQPAPPREEAMAETPSASSRTITVQALARVEGEGALTIRLRDGQVEGVELRIYEPPRFFEAFLRGRPFGEVPDITARICGICPVAYQMSSVHALEQIVGVTLPPPLRALR